MQVIKKISILRDSRSTLLDQKKNLVQSSDYTAVHKISKHLEETRRDMLYRVGHLKLHSLQQEKKYAQSFINGNKEWLKDCNNNIIKE